MLNHIAVQKIEEAINSGAWDNLPGKGQPLNLEEDAHLPEHLRLGHKILRDANVVPEWIAERKSLEAAREKVLNKRANLENKGARQSASKYFEWRKEAREEIETLLRAYNRAVLTWSLKAPRHVAPLRAFEIEAELRAFDERFPVSQSI